MIHNTAKLGGNCLKVLYTISVLICSLLVYKFWPIYENNMFPLFTDITTILLFLPSFFIVFFSFPVSILLTLSKQLKKAIKISMVLLIYMMVFLFSLNALDFYSIRLRGLISFVTSLPGLLHFIISITYVHSKDLDSAKNGLL